MIPREQRRAVDSSLRGTAVTETSQWRRCSACKKPIALGAKYWVCNVSTCNRRRTGLAFCTVSCWEVHLPTVNHRESWAEERWAPKTAAEAEAIAEKAKPRTDPTGTRRLVRESAPAPRATSSGEAPREVLIVASRLKDYIRARSGFNTSESALMPLSDIVRRACEEAIRNAERDGRKTVLDRDVPSRRAD